MDLSVSDTESGLSESSLEAGVLLLSQHLLPHHQGPQPLPHHVTTLCVGVCVCAT